VAETIIYLADYARRSVLFLRRKAAIAAKKAAIAETDKN